MKISPTVREKDADKKKAMRSQLVATAFPLWFGKLDARLADNTASDFAVGSAISPADFKVHEMVRWIQSGVLDDIPSTLLDHYAHIKQLQAKLESDERYKPFITEHEARVKAFRDAAD